MSLKSRTLSPEVLARRIDPVKAAALHAAVACNDLEQTSALLQAGTHPSSRDPSGRSALYVAACSAYPLLVARLLEAGADIDAVVPTDELIDRQRYRGSETALMAALRRGHEDVALLLLERGARTDHQDAFGGEDALLLAAEKGFERAVESILRRGPMQHARLSNQKTALDVAVEVGHVGIVQQLLAAGFPPTAAAARLIAHD